MITHDIDALNIDIYLNFYQLMRENPYESGHNFAFQAVYDTFAYCPIGRK